MLFPRSGVHVQSFGTNIKLANNSRAAYRPFPEPIPGGFHKKDAFGLGRRLSNSKKRSYAGLFSHYFERHLHLYFFMKIYVGRIGTEEFHIRVKRDLAAVHLEAEFFDRLGNLKRIHRTK